MKFFKILFIFLAFLTAGSDAYSCSSCGSGAADPLVLNPMEQRKFYLGLGQQTAFKDIDSRGEVRRDLGPERKRQLELALAQRLSPTLFASLVTGVGQNQRGSRQQMGALDTSLNFRYTPLLQTMAEPWLPQLQLLLSHRFKTTRSVLDAREENYLDSFGSGYNESFYGADVWWGMFPLLFGGSILRSYPWEVDSQAGRLLFGEVQKEILTIGAMLTPELKLTSGLIRERRASIEQDGAELPNSDRLAHDWFMTFETQRMALDNFRLSFSRKASWSDNRNATQLNSMTLAWLRIL